MSFYSLPKKYARKLVIHNGLNIERKYVRDIMSKNGISNHEIEGECLFLDKWNKLSIKTSPVFYRCFSKYIGMNPNILPGDICKSIIEPIMNPVRYRDYYEDKNVFGKLYPKDWMPKTFLRRMNGIFMDEDYNIVSVTKDNVLESLVGVDKFILKPSVDSCSGRGVSLFHKEKDSFFDQNGSVFSFDFLVSKYGNDFIIQACVEQSDYLAKFNPSSINTIRLTVYRSVKDDKLHVTNGIIRIGATESVVDNAHLGGKFCGVNLDGHLNKYVCETYGEISETFNGINFKESNFVIPVFDKVKEFAINIAREIPHHRIIALDIALDKDNSPKLIEYNIGGYGYWLFQMSGQVALQGFTDEIIEYCSQIKDYKLTSINL